MVGRPVLLAACVALCYGAVPEKPMAPMDAMDANGKDLLAKLKGLTAKAHEENVKANLVEESKKTAPKVDPPKVDPPKAAAPVTPPKAAAVEAPSKAAPTVVAPPKPLEQSMIDEIIQHGWDEMVATRGGQAHTIPGVQAQDIPIVEVPHNATKAPEDDIPEDPVIDSIISKLLSPPDDDDDSPPMEDMAPAVQEDEDEESEDGPMPTPEMPGLLKAMLGNLGDTADVPRIVPDRAHPLPPVFESLVHALEPQVEQALHMHHHQPLDEPELPIAPHMHPVVRMHLQFGPHASAGMPPMLPGMPRMLQHMMGNAMGPLAGLLPDMGSLLQSAMPHHLRPMPMQPFLPPPPHHLLGQPHVHHTVMLLNPARLSSEGLPDAVPFSAFEHGPGAFGGLDSLPELPPMPHDLHSLLDPSESMEPGLNGMFHNHSHLTMHFFLPRAHLPTARAHLEGPHLVLRAHRHPLSPFGMDNSEDAGSDPLGLSELLHRIPLPHPLPQEELAPPMLHMPPHRRGHVVVTIRRLRPKLAAPPSDPIQELVHNLL